MHVLTVSGFLTYINETFRAIWDSTEVAVEGEVSGFRVSQGQWVNFEIKDEEATVSVFMVLGKLGVTVQDGMRVRLFGFPRVYPKYGKFSFQADRIELVGEGNLQRALALLRQKFEAEGLLDLSRKRNLTKFPRSVALIASPESAAYGDFVRILKERWGGLKIDLYPVQVQGERAPQQIVRALNRTQNKVYDAIILTRGGGSLEELMAFNDEGVVRAIYASRIPTLVGIGHERDITLAEEVADVRGSTPTDCARRLVPDRNEVLFTLAAYERTLEITWKSWIESWLQRIEHAMQVVDRWLKVMKDQLDEKNRCLQSGVEQWLSRWQERLQTTERLLQSLDPKRVMQRGYAIVQDPAGRVCTRVGVLKVGDDVQLRFQDGQAKAEIIDVQRQTLI